MTDTNNSTPTSLGGDYPTAWEGFCGQARAKLQLRTAAQSARLRGARMDHVLLASGVAGLGKTSLALLTAAEMGAEVRVVSGKVSARHARVVLNTMSDGDVLIFDEIHLAVAGGKANAEWLLHLLQDGQIVGPRGPEKVAAITLIGTTTDAGKLPETILTRFALRPPLVPYTRAEGEEIALALGARVLPPQLPALDAEDARVIARAASNGPRAMRSILIALRDIAITNEGVVRNEDRYDLTIPLQWAGLTDDGLTEQCCAYLRALADDFAGEAVGARTIEDRLQEPGGLGQAERLLMDKGLLLKTRTGRLLTQAGIRRARALGLSEPTQQTGRAA